jgi:hypothetical protein
MQERHPTQFSFNTTTGRFFRSGGQSVRGSNASNGQWWMQRSQPVHFGSSIATIACPMCNRSQLALLTPFPPKT